MIKGMAELMQQAQKMQADMQKAQEQMASQEVIGEAGAGMVRVVMTGRHDVRRVQIDPGVLQEEPAVLEDLLAAAVNDAVRRIEALNREQLAGMTAGMELPPGFKLPL